MGKKWDFSDFEHGMVVCAILSTSETADLLGFLHTTFSRVYREWSERERENIQRAAVLWVKMPG